MSTASSERYPTPVQQAQMSFFASLVSLFDDGKTGEKLNQEGPQDDGAFRAGFLGNVELTQADTNPGGWCLVEVVTEYVTKVGEETEGEDEGEWADIDQFGNMLKEPIHSPVARVRIETRVVPSPASDD